LVAGGVFGGGATNTAEIYDPVTKKWSATGSLPAGRNQHSATLLFDGRVLVAGGQSGQGTPPVNTAVIYDPVAGTWAFTSGTMAVLRTAHRAAPLLDGSVLIAGGHNGAALIPAAELFSAGVPSAPSLNLTVTGPATLTSVLGRSDPVMLV
jgi:hypothetical protein